MNALVLLIAAPFVMPPEAVDLDPDPDIVRISLRAQQESDGRFSYNGISPGPTIRLQLGQTLVVELDNALPDPTTIHWHGLKVPFDMDGVAWMGSPVMPGERFTYMFAVEQAGTFWYHPHFNTAGQVDNGLYGMLIVEDPSEPTANDLVMIFDGADEHQPGPLPGHGHGSGPIKWLLNGVGDSELTLTGGTTHRVRILNASNAAYLVWGQAGMRQIASDQGLLPNAVEQDELLLAPGDRAEVEWSVGTSTFAVIATPFSLNGGASYGAPQTVLRVDVDTPAPAPSPIAWPFVATPPSVDPGYADIMYVFQGSDRSRKWFINGEQFPNVTIETVPLGNDVVIEVRNVSPTHHPFHLHGLTFEVLSINDQPSVRRTIEDTINLRILDRVRIRVRADNPGDWMTHCHILPHADDGMMTVLRVE